MIKRFHSFDPVASHYVCCSFSQLTEATSNIQTQHVVLVSSPQKIIIIISVKFCFILRTSPREVKITLRFLTKLLIINDSDRSQFEQIRAEDSRRGLRRLSAARTLRPQRPTGSNHSSCSQQEALHPACLQEAVGWWRGWRGCGTSVLLHYSLYSVFNTARS